MKLLTYTMDVIVSNKYLEVIIQCPEPKIFKEKIEFLFEFLILLNKTSASLLNILCSRH